MQNCWSESPILAHSGTIWIKIKYLEHWESFLSEIYSSWKIEFFITYAYCLTHGWLWCQTIMFVGWFVFFPAQGFSRTHWFV